VQDGAREVRVNRVGDTQLICQLCLFPLRQQPRLHLWQLGVQSKGGFWQKNAVFVVLAYGKLMTIEAIKIMPPGWQGG
jgi:hypothetical protein